MLTSLWLCRSSQQRQQQQEEGTTSSQVEEVVEEILKRSPAAELSANSLGRAAAGREGKGRERVYVGKSEHYRIIAIIPMHMYSHANILHSVFCTYFILQAILHLQCTTTHFVGAFRRVIFSTPTEEERENWWLPSRRTRVWEALDGQSIGSIALWRPSL